MTSAELEKAFAAWDCATQGHVWLEQDSGLLYSRNSGRDPAGVVPVFCRFCGNIAQLEAHARDVAAPQKAELANEYADVPAFAKVASVAAQASSLATVKPTAGPI